MRYNNNSSIQLLSTTIITTCLLVSGPALALDVKHKPHFIQGDIQQNYYDGVTDDLASAGLGLSGLQGSAPLPADPLHPSAAELRRLAIYNNYRALIDPSTAGGMGRFYGPNIKADGSDGQGLISGYELLAYANYGKGRKNVTLMVQVPDSFNPDDPCIVTAPSSGSRGIYGAIGTAGDWGLKHGCAVAYTDDGKGTGAHNLATNTVNLIDGTPADAEIAGDDALFTAPLSEHQRQTFNEEFPHRIAIKHAHSQQNPEQDWGRNVLQSVQFAFYVLNQLYSIEKSIKPGNTIVIASSVSNGGGASVRAAEMDNHNLIDGVAVSEPNVNPVYNRHFSIVQGANSPLYAHSRSLLDYTSLVNVYQGCANLAPANSGAPFNFAPSADACASLFDKGLLHSTELAEQASEAQRIINDYGILTEQNLVQPSHWFVNVPQSISVTYANAYGRFSVVRNLCGYSFAAIDGSGQPAPLDTSVEAILFGTSNGIPPTGGIQLINNDSLGGSLENRLSLSPSTGRADQNLDGALCLRNLVAGTNRVDFFKSLRIRSGIAQVRATGRLKGKPSIFVTGRNDAILPPNHTSRAYFGLTRLLEGKRSNMHYYEVTNAHHLDAFNALAGFNDKFIPLHHYFLQAMDLMYAHLKFHQALPPSQVIHTTARGFNSEGVVPDLDETLHLPGIAMNPAESDLIFFRHRQVRIPE